MKNGQASAAGKKSKRRPVPAVMTSEILDAGSAAAALREHFRGRRGTWQKQRPARMVMLLQPCRAVMLDRSGGAASSERVNDLAGPLEMGTVEGA